MAALVAIVTAQGWLELVQVLLDEMTTAAVNAQLGEGLVALNGSIGDIVAEDQAAIDEINGEIAADNTSLGLWNGVYNNAQAACNNDIAQIASLMTQLTALEAECGG